MMAKEEIDDKLGTLRQREREAVLRVEDFEGQIAEYQIRLADIRGEIRGIEYTRDLFALVPGETDASPVRHSVQRPVMNLLRKTGPGNPLPEDVIAEKTDLPRASVHDFILRAVREGKIVADGGLYSLPGEPAAGEQREAAE